MDDTQINACIAVRDLGAVDSAHAERSIPRTPSGRFRARRSVDSATAERSMK